MTKRFFILAAAALAASTLFAIAQEKPKVAPAPQAPPKVKPVQPPGTPHAPGQADIAPAPAPDPNAKPPKMVVEKLEFDGGAISKGQVIEAEFLVKNIGAGPLQIQRVQPACGCTVPSFDKEILPGQSGKIKASVNTQAFSGPITKTVQVFTNDPDMATFTLTIKADVKAILNILPRETEQVGLIFKGQAVEKEFTIKSEDGQPFQITQVQTEDNNVRYEIVPEKDKLSAKFLVKVPADYPVGPITARFTLSTSHPKVPTLSINLFGTIREPLTVYPKEIVFNGLAKDYIVQNPQDPALNKMVTVAFETGPELTIQKIDSSVPFLTTSFEATAPNQRYSVKIHLDPEKVKAGEFGGQITIVTNKQPIVIPVRGRVF